MGDDSEDAGSGTVSGRGRDGGSNLGEQREQRGRGVGGTGETAFFDHERLEVFQVARKAYLITKGWKARKMPPSLRDQFDRSTLSIVSNIAEGAAKFSKPEKRRLYEIAKGSTNEAGAQLEILHL